MIGPIGDRFSSIGSRERETYEEALEVFEKVVVPACQEHGLEAIRADQIAISGEITEQVFRHLYEDEVVIADVSGGNPNVMYELGMRHTRNLLTIQIGEFGQLPFDVSAIRTIQFSRSERGLIDARKLLQRALAAGLSEGGDPLTATRIWSTSGEVPLEPSAPDVVGAAEVAVIEPDGLLESMETVEEVFPLLTELITNVGTIMEEMGVDADASTREMDMANAGGVPTSARLAIVHRFGKALDGHAAKLIQAVDSYVPEMERINAAVNGIIDFLEAHPDSVEEQSLGFLETLTNLAATTRESMESMSGMAGSAEELGAMSKALRPPARRISNAIAEMARSSAVIDEWASRAHRIRTTAERRNREDQSDALT